VLCRRAAARRTWLEEDFRWADRLPGTSQVADGRDTMSRPDSALYCGIYLAGATEWPDKRHA